MSALSNLNAETRVRWIHRAVCLFFLIGIGMSLPLWAGERLFPHIPVFRGMELPGAVHWVLAGLLAIALVVNMLQLKKLWAVALLTLMTLIILPDQMRLQPWVFVYFLILFPLGLVALTAKNAASLLNYVQILLIGVYVWSGLHKFTQSFIDIIYPLLLKGLFKISDDSYLLEAREWGYLLAAVELSIGIGLVFPKTRNVAVIGAVFTHLLIIAWVLIGNPNYTILPWNAAMIAVVILSSWNVKNRISLWPATSPGLRWATAALALLIWLMPVLNIKNKWDAYLSFNLYTERISHMYVGLRQQALEGIDPRLSDYYAEENLIEEGRVIDVEKWSFDELKVPVYPALRVHKAIGRYFCKAPANADQIMLVTFRRPFREGHYEVFFCKDCE
jgi:hypothetical protein